MTVHHLSPTELARALAARRRRERRRCVVCGAETIGTIRRRYCSPRCASRASYARHAEQRRAAKREQYRRKKQQAPLAAVMSQEGTAG